jgi:hypothetical protein
VGKKLFDVFDSFQKKKKLAIILTHKLRQTEKMIYQESFSTSVHRFGVQH